MSDQIDILRDFDYGLSFMHPLIQLKCFSSGYTVSSRKFLRSTPDIDVPGQSRIGIYYCME